MPTIIRTVKNLTANTLILSHRDVILEPNVTVDLYTILTDDRLLQLQSELQGLADRGAIQIVATDAASELTAGGAESVSGDLTVTGTVIGYADNATSLRVRGPNAPSEGGIDVQSYSGIFYNDAYATTGTLKTRVIHGANLEMDLEIQSPHQLRIAAVDDTQADGEVFIASRTGVTFNLRADAEVASPKQLVIDRISTGATGVSNTSDINLKTNSGSIFINAGVTTGALGLPTLDDTQRDALVAVAGMTIFNSSTNKLNFYNGTAWEVVTSATV
jgi:hypothetical protein